MSAAPPQSIERLRRALAQRILIVDGAMGTSIQALDLGADDFGGEAFDGCNERLNLTRPDAIEGIHRGFLEAGADVIETNSFGAMPVVLAEYDIAEEAEEIGRAAAEIARRAADAFATEERPRWVAGSIGPTTKSLSVTGGTTWDELVDSYRTVAAALGAGGADFLLIETSQDPLNVKAALEGIDQAREATGLDLPVALQATIETMGTILGGQDVEAFYTTFAHRDLLWIGLNCATGPEFMTDHVRTLAAISRFPVACLPNAGLPDEDGRYNETPEMIAAVLERFADNGWVNVLGGCCGTVPGHIERIGRAAGSKAPRVADVASVTRLSGLDTLIVDEDTRPVLVGERANVLGSRKFRRLINEGSIEEAAEVGRNQVRGGAHVLDVCLQDPDRDEVEDVTTFLAALTKKVKTPIVIDSTDAAVIEEALKLTPGKSLINSVNLEDGEERFQLVVPLAKRYGAALVVGCIDEDKEQAQAITRERKLAIAQRSHDILTQKYGVAPEDIVFDPLVFPVGTGDENYIGSGVETIEGVRLIKEALPRCKTVLGVSNVSFGLPPAGRETLNSVFLYHCVQAGLDMAIVNSEKLERYPTIPEEDRRLAEDLIFWRGDDPIAAFAAHFRERRPAPTAEARAALPLDERLARCVVEGTKEGLTDDLDLAMAERPPMAIINGPLMAGMEEVGRLFNDNRLIVAEVLQSAEAMKAAVTHLEPHMEKAGGSVKGKIVLATVKGDVHDIGKNLVDIVLSNNGYQVVNLGIKVPPQDLIAAVQQHAPDAIGLSGLLVKSAQMMVETARDLTDAGVDAPILVGGAALSNRFTRLRIAPEYEGVVAYARDAMDGLSLANTIMDGERREELALRLREESETLAREQKPRAVEAAPAAAGRAASVRADVDIPTPPDLKAHVLTDYDLDEMFPFINPQMLYVRHLGFRGRFAEALERGDEKALRLRRQVREVEEAMLAAPSISARAVFKWFPAQSDGRQLLIYAPDGTTVIERFLFGRQREGDGLCLADYAAPVESGRMDYVAMFVTTVGSVRAMADRWRDEGEYLKSHALHALAIESAEGFAELVHQRIRTAWGFGDPPETTKEMLFKARYRGKRYSFGYPACPRLEDQERLFSLLEAEERTGVALTEGHMMDPESSVSALVFHHPDAKYFNLSEADAEALEREFAPAR